MRIYESTFILSPQADDAAFDRQIKAATDIIGNNGGKIIQEDRWGIRRLAYPIKKFTQGFYTRLVFEGTNQVLTELERFYKLEEPYIRYLTILCEGDPKLHNPYGIIPINPEKYPHVQFEWAERFAKWLVSEKAQAIIANYKIQGQQAFFPDALPGF